MQNVKFLRKQSIFLNFLVQDKLESIQKSHSNGALLITKKTNACFTRRISITI